MAFGAQSRRFARSTRSTRGWTCLAVVALAQLACQPVMTAPSGAGAGSTVLDDADLFTGGGQAAADEVLVRFINLSDADVDTQFHATNMSLDDPPNDLIDPQFAVQTELGVFGSGVLLTDQTGEFSVDEITFPCSETTILGTAGGEYLDPDLGTPLATGQSRVVQVGINFDCGNTIIFTFTGSEGEYTTEPAFVDFSD